MKDQKVGLLMGIYNEAHRVEACLKFHMPCVDEVVVVIQESDDGTEEVVERVKAEATIPFEILYFPKMGCSEATLQDGANKLTSDWILYVDADEKFPLPFLQRMHEEIKTTEVDAFRFERDNWFNVRCYADSVPIEPKFITVQHPARDSQVRLTRASLSNFPRQIHVRCRVKRKDGSEHIRSLHDPIYHLKDIEEQWTDNINYLPQTTIVDFMEKTKHDQVTPMHEVLSRGVLRYAQVPNEIPFGIKRIFTISKADGESRGGHANKEVHEMVYCLRGKVKFTLDNGIRKNEFVLSDPRDGLFIKSLTWVEITDIEDDAIILVLASELYDPNKYIRNYDEFMKELQR